MSSLFVMEVTTQQLATLTGVSAEAIRKAVREGRIPSKGRGRFALGETLQAYCAGLRSVASGHGTVEEAADLTQERALLAKAQREAVDLKNAVARGELVGADDVVAEWQDILALVRANMLTVPVMAQQRLPHLSKHDVHVLGEVVRDMLTRSADDDRSSEFLDPEGEGAPGA
ncbi:MAG: hypothetical protein U1E59_20325 [Amaricoccus sp.]